VCVCVYTDVQVCRCVSWNGGKEGKAVPPGREEAQ
jgi:hypothetical protein